tara:strand:- start:67 stop:441 length:375 start_codon:yes stop_codon:yes gene_type:complete
MEATVLLKIIEETDKHTLSFDVADFDLLYESFESALTHIQELGAEGFLKRFQDQEPSTDYQSFVHDGGLDEEWGLFRMDGPCSTVLGLKIAQACGHDAYVVRDSMREPEWASTWCVLTNYTPES